MWSPHPGCHACTNNAFRRDDLTVQVIFFGNGERVQDQTQGIIVNDEATAPPRAKL